MTSNKSPKNTIKLIAQYRRPIKDGDAVIVSLYQGSTSKGPGFIVKASRPDVEDESGVVLTEFFMNKGEAADFYKNPVFEKELKTEEDFLKGLKGNTKAPDFCGSCE